MEFVYWKGFGRKRSWHYGCTVLAFVSRDRGKPWEKSVQPVFQLIFKPSIS
jgi:hypothetical protein